jgi:hypothetical protein
VKVNILSASENNEIVVVNFNFWSLETNRLETALIFFLTKDFRIEYFRYIQKCNFHYSIV